MPAFSSIPTHNLQPGYVPPASDSSVRARRLTVCDVFQRHIHCLSALPGEISQFEETGVGYEWRCQMTLQEAIVRGSAYVDLLLQFSLLDMEGRPRPAAVLFLVEQAAAGQERLYVPLEDRDAVIEKLYELLLPRGGSIEAMTLVQGFVDALISVRNSLGSEVDWA